MLSPALEICLDAALDAEQAERADVLIRELASVFTTLRQASGLNQQSIEVIVAEDLTHVVRSMHGQVVGVERLDQFASERPSGMVIGKTLFRDEAHSDAVVVLDALLFQNFDPEPQLVAWRAVAHEFAHVHIGYLRAAGGGGMSPAWKPFEVAEWIARYAFEEYLADGLSGHLLESCVTIQVSGVSQRLSLSDHLGPIESPALQAGEMMRSIADHIQSYRTGNLDLLQMWGLVHGQTAQLLIVLAHAQADAASRGIAASDTTLAMVARPLDVAWTGLVDAFNTVALGSPSEFVKSERRILKTSASEIIELWRALGLTFEVEEGNARIDVAPPSSSWPYSRSQ